MSYRSFFFFILRGTNAAITEDLSNIVEDENSTNPEENSEHFLAVVIECLALLNKIPETVEVRIRRCASSKFLIKYWLDLNLQTIKVQMQTELLNIIARTSKKIREIADNQPACVKPISTDTSDVKIITSNNSAEKQSLLLDLLQTVFEQFRLVAATHATVLRSLSHVVKKYNLDVRLYEMPDVWSKIQAVVSYEWLCSNSFKKTWFYRFLSASVITDGISGHKKHGRRSVPDTDGPERTYERYKHLLRSEKVSKTKKWFFIQVRLVLPLDDAQ